MTVYLARRAEPVLAAAIIGGLATVGMLFVLFRNVYPAPAAPYNVLPWIFLGLLVVAGGWYAVVRSRGIDPGAVDTIEEPALDPAAD